MCGRAYLCAVVCARHQPGGLVFSHKGTAQSVRLVEGMQIYVWAIIGGNYGAIKELLP